MYVLLLVEPGTPHYSRLGGGGGGFRPPHPGSYSPADYVLRLEMNIYIMYNAW